MIPGTAAGGGWDSETMISSSTGKKVSLVALG